MFSIEGQGGWETCFRATEVADLSVHPVAEVTVIPMSMLMRAETRWPLDLLLPQVLSMSVPWLARILTHS